jgi:hydroxymethylpyrimidine/phosphomethylpyrimidine kinase
MKHVLSIAGSDSSGGAGIQADLKAFAALGVYGMTAITALTAQNTQGVGAVSLTDPAMLRAQIDAVFTDIRVDAVKIGMLGDIGLIRTVAACLRHWKPRSVVLDPVMISKSGHHLLAPQAVDSLRSELLPLADLVTPNLPEAAELAGFPVDALQDMEAAATALRRAGARAVLVKGGHLQGEADDLLADESGIKLIHGVRIEAAHTHGTGCSLSSAIAALLARGTELEAAVREAKEWVSRGIAQGLAVGKGCGPIHHFHRFYDNEGVMR